jgi:hypothetical protein
MTEFQQDERTTHAPLCIIAETKFDEMEKRFELLFEELDKRLDVLFAERDRMLDMRFHSLHLAIDKSEHIMDVRLQGMNQFRQQITEERASFATRRESILITFIISLVLVAVGLFFSHLTGKP